MTASKVAWLQETHTTAGCSSLLPLALRSCLVFRDFYYYCLKHKETAEEIGLFLSYGKEYFFQVQSAMKLGILFLEGTEIRAEWGFVVQPLTDRRHEGWLWQSSMLALAMLSSRNALCVLFHSPVWPGHFCKP